MSGQVAGGGVYQLLQNIMNTLNHKPKLYNNLNPNPQTLQNPEPLILTGRYPVEGYQNGGVSGPGKAGGSAISPKGWLFDICDDPERCIKDPTFGLSVWFRRLWQVRHAEP